MTPTQKLLVDTFGETSERYGWEIDQGSPESARSAEADRDLARQQLEKMIDRLNARIKKS
jgi:hypothetical protein